MRESPLHVVLGTGQVGLALTALLAEPGLPVRAVSRHRPAVLAAGVDRRSADVSGPGAATDAARARRSSTSASTPPTRSGISRRDFGPADSGRCPRTRGPSCG